MGARREQLVPFYPHTHPGHIPHENTPAGNARAEAQAARMRTALRTALTRRRLDPSDESRLDFSPIAVKQADRVFHTLDKLHGLVTAKREPPTFKLSDFDYAITESPEAVVEKLQHSTFLPVGEQEFQDLVGQAMTVGDRSYFNQKGAAGYTLIERFDELAYARIQQEYGLGSIDDAKTFYEERMDQANEVIENLIPSRHKGKGDVTSLINEASFITSPGRAVLYALWEQNVDRRLTYEALRTLTIAELLSQNAQYARGLKAIIGEYQTALTDSIFDHGQKIGEITPVGIYAIFDMQTGEPLWNSHSDQPLSPEQYEAYRERGILKLINFNVRQSDDGNKVLTEPRTKGQQAILEKMINDAHRRKTLLGDELIEPGGVSDMGGIMQVLLDETSLNGPTMTAFIERHKQIATEIFGGEEGKDVDFVERDETNGDNGQSQEHHFRRVDIIVKKDGREYKIEMIFVPLVQYLKNHIQHGTVDDDLYKPNGPAHKVYEATRWTIPASVLFPEASYGEHDWKKMSEYDVAQAVDEIRRQDAIDFQELPLEYRNAGVTSGVVFEE